MFDTIGTLVGVTQQAGLMKDGELPRARAALTSDACGTILGSLLGTSTVTSYVESSAGVSEGGRSGLANVVTAALFLLALFFYPIVQMVGGAVEVAGATPLYLHPPIAPVLIIMGSTMLRNVRKINWEDATEWIPAFLCLIIMPFTLSITEGIAFGFISYAILKVATGRYREVHPLTYIFSIAFIVRYILMPGFLAR